MSLSDSRLTIFKCVRVRIWYISSKLQVFSDDCSVETQSFRRFKIKHGSIEYDLFHLILAIICLPRISNLF